MDAKIIKADLLHVALLPSEMAAVDDYRTKQDFAGRSDAGRALILLGLQAVKRENKSENDATG